MRFLYTGTPGNDGTMMDLGTLTGYDTFADAINNLGDVAGYGLVPSRRLYTRHAFLYTGVPDVNGAMIDLDAWLKVNDPLDGANWTLTEATGINDAGLITGYGQYNDGVTTGTRAFLLDA
jgi:hypothetical protein